MEIEMGYSTPEGDYYGIQNYNGLEVAHIAEMRGFGYCSTDPERLRDGLPSSVFVPASLRTRFASDFAARFGEGPPDRRGLQQRTLKSSDAA